MIDACDQLSLTPSQGELTAVFDAKYRRARVLGWGPKLRLDFGYFVPDDYYEAIVTKLVRPGTWWADVGCGRYVFPSNEPLAKRLSERCGFLFGIDPDPNIRDNKLISEGFEGVVEDCDTRHRFDLITLRMVAEHIQDPDRSIAKLGELLKPGGLIVIYTPNKWAPMSIMAALVPNRFHHRMKTLIWDVEERDTFPTAFRLNTRPTLERYCSRQGLEEVFFVYLDDCRTWQNFRWLNYVELLAQRGFRSLGFRYPENCLLGVYRKG